MSLELTQYNMVNYGPNAKGIENLLHISLEMDGLKIRGANIFPGFNRRNFEDRLAQKNVVQALKVLEHFDWDSSAPYNASYAFALAVEHAVGEEAPMGAQLMRMILSELSRIKGHLSSVGLASSLLSFSPVTKLVQMILAPLKSIFYAADRDYKLFPFGFERSFSEDFTQNLKATLNYFEKHVDRLSKDLLHNVIFKMRTVDIGVLSKGECLSMGVTGFALRASGGAWDLRHKVPYDAYRHVSFQVPIGSAGDAYERMVVRIEEMRQSVSIIRQCLDLMSKDVFPMSSLGKRLMQKSLEKKSSSSVMKYACAVSKGVFLPQKTLHGKIEGTRGEVSVFSAVDPSGTMLKDVNIRTGTYFNLQAVEFLLRGHMYMDIGTILTSFDINAKDVDR